MGKQNVEILRFGIGSRVGSSLLDSHYLWLTLCKVKIPGTLLLLLILITAGCKPAAPSNEESVDADSLPPFDPSSQQTITYLEIDHARHFLESNLEVTIIDVRGEDDFAKAHLPGAINFPYDPDAKKKDLDQGLRELTNNETGKIYLVYGSKENYYAIDVVGRLVGDGYQFLFCFRQDSGIEDWIENELPIVPKIAAK